MARPAPLRVMGKRGREDGRGEFFRVEVEWG